MSDQNSSFGSFSISETQDLDPQTLADAFLGGSPIADPEDVVAIAKDKGDQIVVKNDKDDTEENNTDFDLENEEDLAGNFLNDSVKDKAAPKKKDTKAEDPEDIVTDPDPEEDDEPITRKEDGDSNKFVDYYNDLVDIGIFTKPEEGEETPPQSEAELLERWQSELRNQAGQYLENTILAPHGKEGMEMFQAVFMHGVHPAEYLGRYATIESISELDITEESNQELIVRNYYKSLKWPSDKIDSKIQRLKTSEDLEEEAAVAKDKLLEREAALLQQQVEQKKLENERVKAYKENYKTRVNKILADGLKTKEIGGIPITDKMAREAFSNLVDERYENPTTGELYTEFDRRILMLRREDNFEKKVKMMLFMELLEKDPALSTIKKKGVTEESKEIFSRSLKKNTEINNPKSAPNMNTFGKYLK